MMKTTHSYNELGNKDLRLKEGAGYRILSKGTLVSNNTHETRLNNNDLIIGPTGFGKTRSYCKSNIMQCNESMIITDTKGNIQNEMSDLLIYTQAIHSLCYSADHDYDNHSLPVPVRFYFDDFVAGTYIPDFDKIISIIRSRNIAVSIILQSITQLDHFYGQAASRTIINGCDHLLYLGGQDILTAELIAKKANKALEDILYLLLDEAYLLRRGKAPR